MFNLGVRVGTVTAAALIAVALAGCTSLDPSLVPPSQPTGSAEPTPSAPPSPQVVPTPRLSQTCSDLVPLEAMRATLTDDVAFVPARTHFRSPEETALEQLGALRCVWANGTPRPPWEDADPDYAEAVLQIVPDAEDSWERYSAIYSRLSAPSPYGEDAIGPNCSGATDDLAGPESHNCHLDALVGSYWVGITLEGVGGNTAASDGELVVIARTVIDPLLSKLSNEGQPPPQWTPPPASPVSCDLMLSDSEAAALTGVEGLGVGPFWDGPKSSQLVHGLEGTGADRCHLNILGSDVGIGLVSFLPSGGWAFREHSAAWIDTGDAVPVNLAGAREGEEFTEECARVEEDCRIDMLVGENWIQVMTYAYVPEKMYYPEDIDMLHARSQTRALAEKVLENLHAAE